MTHIPVGLTEIQIQEIADSVGIPVSVVKAVASDHQMLAEFMRRHVHFSEADAVEFLSCEVVSGDE